MSDIKLPAAPIGALDSFEEQVKLFFDLIALAYRADLTRVVSYMMVSEGTNRTYNQIGVSDSFHPVSHHANDLGRIEKLVKIQTWHMDRFAEFLGKLAAVRDGEGTLLDNSMFLYGSNMSNSDKHNGHPLPTILVGGGGRQTDRRKAYRIAGTDSVGERASDDSAQGRSGTEKLWRQHRHDCGRVIGASNEWKSVVSTGDVIAGSTSNLRVPSRDLRRRARVTSAPLRLAIADGAATPPT